MTAPDDPYPLAESPADPGASGPTVERFDSGARHRLTAATRALVDAVLTAEAAPDDLLVRAADDIDAITRELTTDGTTPGRRDRNESSHDEYLPRSPVIGTSNPVAPPVVVRVDGSRVLGEVTFGAAYEGPPGYVHGGVVALVFDEMLGMVNVVTGNPGMTAVLTVKYRRPTPLYAAGTLEAWIERSEGRKTFARGRLTVDGAVTAEAEGLFVRPHPDRILEYFGDDTSRAPDPLP